MTSSGSVFTIDPETAFVDALAAGILDRYAKSPDGLTGVTVLLPTRRACRALGEAFLRATDGAPLLLPAMTPIGDIDEDEIGFLAGERAEAAADLPPAIPAMTRRLLLTRLILARADMEARPSPAHAALLADELARLIDETQIERLDFEKLEGLVPDDFAEHWQQTLSFLRIVTENWPTLLAEQGCLDPADRRNRLIDAQIGLWRARPPAGPVIAAGSTGSIPATADLLACVAGLAEGAVVLPGLDRTLDPESLAALGPTHPQFGMARLIERLGCDIAGVPDWTGAGAALERTRLINLALRPPATARSALSETPVAAAFASVRRIDCPGLQQEAMVIALTMREALETPGRTAALVTPDRRLARRVAAELRRWDIDVDDSAGTPVADSQPGVFLRLAAEALVDGAAPIPLLALLKHPLAAAGRPSAGFRDLVRAIELETLRGPRPAPGLDGLCRALEASDGRTRDSLACAQRLAALAAPFAEILEDPRADVAALVERHVGFAEALAATDADAGVDRLWSGDAGEALAALIAEIRNAAAALGPVRGRDWPALLDALMAGAVVRPAYGRHPRLHIWGLLEARLQQADLVILGSLNEGTWPPQAAADAWMSRPMRAEFGLPPPERRIGLTAHDFVQGFAAREVVLTRSTRVDGSPTVPARWLTRLETMLSAAPDGCDVLDRWRAEERRRLRWQSRIDLMQPQMQPRVPAPMPPVAARPTELPVTDIERLIRDPYEIYARRILRLRALDPIDQSPGAAERGSIVHDAIDGFFGDIAAGLPDDALDRLLEAGRRAFAPYIDRPGVRAFWWPRFERIAQWLVDLEAARLDRLQRRHTELTGRLEIDIDGRPFVLTARADRIDELTDGTRAIVDYKTGSLPSKADVNAGLSPQLPLEAAIVAGGGFPGVSPGPVAELAYWRMSGGDPPGETRDAGGEPDTLARDALAGVRDLIRRYTDPATAYVACPDPEKAPRYSDYRHLERVQEWASALGGGE